MRLLPALAFAVVSLLAALAFAPALDGRAQTEDGLSINSNITYNVKTEEGPVRVAWDIQIVNNDPDTAFSETGTVFFYENLSIPVVRGAANAAAIDGDNAPLTVSIEDPDHGIAQLATIGFASPLFYQETYNVRLTYDIPDTRGESILITPNYAFLPLIAAGDQATVTVNTPAGDHWEVSLEAEECTQDGNIFSCVGPQSAYLVATVEVNQPAATQTLSFEVPLERMTLAVNLVYLQGEDAAAAHQRDLITAGLPLIEQAMGFSYDGPELLNIAHGGRQSVLGYEGLTSCDPNASCEVVLSPIADDFTVLHEMSHLWSNVFSRRWLSEGFAQLTPEEVAPLMPEGLVQGAPPQRDSSNVALQLDEWEALQPVIGADDDQLALIDAGYDYSLRFLQELSGRFGTDSLRAVNRNIAGSGEPADSRRFMDVLEEATGANLDDLFLIWVFPGSFRETLAERREAKERLNGLRERLAEADLPDEGLVAIQTDIRDWDFAEAIAGIDTLEANVDIYGELLGQLSELETDVQLAGLVLYSGISDELLRFEFEAARGQLGSAREALSAYTAASTDLDEPRDLWARFGLLGSDPEGELRAAEDAFANGSFGASTEHSHNASDIIAEAPSVALRRLLIVGGFLGLIALALGVAFAVTQLRQRELAER